MEGNAAPSRTRAHSTVLVTGAAGFFGSRIAAKFLGAGIHVVVFDELNAETTSADEKEANLRVLQDVADRNGARLGVFRGDVLDAVAIRRMLDETAPTACVHAASMVDDRRSVSHPTECITVNVIGTQTLLQTIAEHGSVKQFVYISTRSTFGQVDSPGRLMTEEAPKRPINPCGASKVGAEAICHVYHHLYGIDVNIIRIFALFGPYGRPDMIPRQPLENVLHARSIPKFGTGEATRDWLYVEDAADAVFLAAHQPMGYETFNIGTGRGTSLDELIAIAEDVVGKPAIIEHLPVPPGDAHYVGIADNAKARALPGWRPTTTVHEGMRRTLERMREDALATA